MSTVDPTDMEIVAWVGPDEFDGTRGIKSGIAPVGLVPLAAKGEHLDRMEGCAIRCRRSPTSTATASSWSGSATPRSSRHWSRAMPLTDAEVLAQMNDLEMLRRHHLWPGAQAGLRCVFVKRRASSNTGYVILWGTSPDEYHLTWWDWNANGERHLSRYDSPEKILEDGWLVD